MSGAERITVMIVDDHPVVREGLNAMISVESDMVVVGEAGTAAEAIELFAKLRPNVILMDLLLPDLDGSEAIRRIAGKSSDVSIVVITSVGADEQIYEALEAGARGYLFKDMVRKELLQAIKAVRMGRRYIPAQVGIRLAEGLPRPSLSAREIEVLQLVAVGNRNKEIAYDLKLSEATVNAHIKHILQKLHASDRTEAVTIALKRGFIRL